MWSRKVFGTLSLIVSAVAHPQSGAGQPLAPFTLPQRVAHPWLVRHLERSIGELERIFQTPLTHIPTIVTVPPENLAAVLGDSTQGLYRAGVIYVAAGAVSSRNRDPLRRTIRHEAVHAAIAELSGAAGSAARCPAWFEEGLAQIYEGGAPIVSRIRVRRDEHFSHTLPLAALEENLTQLDPELVGLAYAQSRFAVQKLLNAHGISKIKTYFDQLRQGGSHPEAFAKAFDHSLDEFELEIAREFALSMHTGASF